MFQPADKATLDGQGARQNWIALLARAPEPLLEPLVPQWQAADFVWLRSPETGLYMVRGRIGGNGERFNLGEMTVTRCTLRLRSRQDGGDGDGDGNGNIGIGYVLGRSHRHASIAAFADACLQDPARRDELERTLLAPIRQAIDDQRAARRDQAESTRVDFMTIAREAASDLPASG